MCLERSMYSCAWSYILPILHLMPAFLTHPSILFLILLTQPLLLSFFFFLNDPAPPEISPLPLPDALPIPTAGSSGAAGAAGSRTRDQRQAPAPTRTAAAVIPTTGSHQASSPKPWCGGAARMASRSEEHTSELQSLAYIVCRLLLEKKKIIK